MLLLENQSHPTNGTVLRYILNASDPYQIHVNRIIAHNKVLHESGKPK